MKRALITLPHPLPPPACCGAVVRAERIDPLAGDEWDALVTPRLDHSVFHRSAWARVLAETYQHRPVYLRVMVAGREAALMPLMEVSSPVTGRRGVSLPFADFAGPLWTQPEHAAAVYQALLGVAAERKWKHLELRGGSPPPPGARPFRTYRAHELDLTPGLAALESRLPASTRRSIHKAARSGLAITIRQDAGAIRDFYQLHSVTRRRRGLPPQPWLFFQAIGRNLLEPGWGAVVMARLAGTAVAGAVFLHTGGRALYKFGASDPAYWGLRPNHWVIWRAVQWLLDCGCRSLHFGRTSAYDAGLIRFKHSWGCGDGGLDYFRYHVAKRAWITGEERPAESLPMVFGHLPLSLNRIAGRLIYPHLD